MTDASHPPKIHQSPDGRTWGKSRTFVTGYKSFVAKTPSLYHHYTALRQIVQKFINDENIDDYEIVKHHDREIHQVSMRLYWQPLKRSGG